MAVRAAVDERAVQRLSRLLPLPHPLLVRIDLLVLHSNGCPRMSGAEEEMAVVIQYFPTP